MPNIISFKTKEKSKFENDHDIFAVEMANLFNVKEKTPTEIYKIGFSLINSGFLFIHYSMKDSLSKNKRYLIKKNVICLLESMVREFWGWK